MSEEELPEIGRAAVGGACVLFDPQGRVLLVKHSYGMLNWSLPGGLALEGEDPRTTAERELREETGLDLRAGRLTGVYFEPQHDFGPFLHFVFSVAWQEGLEPTPMPPEITQLGWFDPDDVPRPISDFTARRIRDALTNEPPLGVIEQKMWLE
jgi:8-oxo-dGTP pyrophosphatase MutT (NUDIX family)